MMPRGVTIINNSWGAGLKCEPVQTGTSPACSQNDHVDPYRQAIDHYMSGTTDAFTQEMAKAGAGAVLVVAAGNQGVREATNPWSYIAAKTAVRNVITVASIDSDSNLSGFSNFGPHVDVAAPGGFGPDDKDILSTVAKSAYGRKHGTSMAAPMVAGEAALVAQLHPDWTGTQIADCIRTASSSTVVSRNDLDDSCTPTPAASPSSTLPRPSTAEKPDRSYAHRRSPPAGYHSCALDTSGAAWCWGDNQYGHGIGDTTGTAKFSPVEVAGGHTFTTVTAGVYSSCALDTSGAAWCWGHDTSGALGDGDALGTTKFSPVEVAGGHTFATITAGDFFACALDVTGSAWCWGNNYHGELGDGDTSHMHEKIPVAVTGGHTFVTITAGWYHTCALDPAGSAWCWGDGEYGALGDGDVTGTGKFSPVDVAGGYAFTTIAAGGNHTCALDGAGEARCWGSDGYGQLGDSDAAFALKFAPVAVAGGHTFRTVAAGGYHSCALDSAGTAWCWGYDWAGQLGDGDGAGNQSHPVAVADAHTFTTIAAGADDSCALDTGGRAWCWGYDAHGQLGDGSTAGTNKFAPVAVVGGHTWHQP